MADAHAAPLPARLRGPAHGEVRLAHRSARRLQRKSGCLVPRHRPFSAMTGDPPFPDTICSTAGSPGGFLRGIGGSDPPLRELEKFVRSPKPALRQDV